MSPTELGPVLDGQPVGSCDGTVEIGDKDGDGLGKLVNGDRVGLSDGTSVGLRLGASVGLDVAGVKVGKKVSAGAVGLVVDGITVGSAVG